MGFGILAGSFSRGLNNGINAANSLQERKDRKDRQATLDQRYQDGIDRQATLDQRNETRYLGLQKRQDAALETSDKRYKAGIEDAKAEREYQHNRQGISDKRASTKFDNSQSDRENKLAIQRGFNTLTVASKGDDESITKAFLTSKNGKSLMEQYGLKDVNLHMVPGKNAQGKPEGRLYISAIGKDGVRGLFDPITGEMHGADDEATYLNRNGQIGLWMNSSGLTQDQATAAQAKFIQSQGKLSDREKLKLTSKNKIDVANAKPGKDYTLTDNTGSQKRYHADGSQVVPPNKKGSFTYTKNGQSLTASQDDLAHTAEVNNMTVEQVKALLSGDSKDHEGR